MASASGFVAGGLASAASAAKAKVKMHFELKVPIGPVIGAPAGGGSPASGRTAVQVASGGVRASGSGSSS
jgi:hypothetical protein